MWNAQPPSSLSLSNKQNCAKTDVSWASLYIWVAHRTNGLHHPPPDKSISSASSACAFCRQLLFPYSTWAFPFQSLLSCLPGLFQCDGGVGNGMKCWLLFPFDIQETLTISVFLNIPWHFSRNWMFCSPGVFSKCLVKLPLWFQINKAFFVMLKCNLMLSFAVVLEMTEFQY